MKFIDPKLKSESVTNSNANSDTNSAINIGRVSSVARNHYGVLTLTGEKKGVLSGKLLNNEEYPVIGDYVTFREMSDTEVYLEEILERKNLLSRAFMYKDLGFSSAILRQDIAANVDKILIVTSADLDFSIRRIERFLACTEHCHAKPIIILNKIDKVSSTTEMLDQINQLGKDLKVICTSATEGIGIQELEAFLEGTVIILGSSGVGKSSLINTLIEEGEEAKTSATRAVDDKGRHTTTQRTMFSLKSAKGIIIDNPGIREIQIWANEEDVMSIFSDITELAEKCQYSDCAHEKEKNCAVKKAIKEGLLDSGRLKAFRMFIDESKMVALHEENAKMRKSEKTRKSRIDLHLKMKGKR